MRLSNKGRHALTAMLYLTAHYQRDRLVTLRELEQCQTVSLSYLEQLFSSLRKQGLVTGIRGPGGGYRLGRPPMDITIIDVLGAVDLLDVLHLDHLVVSLVASRVAGRSWLRRTGWCRKG